MREPIISFDHFGFQYNAQQKPTLYDINLKIYPGEKVLITGPSGCGKSTLVHCINGLIPFSYKGEMTGSLTLNGVETRDLSIFDISHQVGTVLQDSDSQFVGLTVAEDIAFALENDCMGEPDLHNRVDQVARMVGMEDFLKHAPGDLSGGQKQRVSMAGVMVDDVKLVLYDEPLANLDPATGKTAIELIDDMQKQSETAVVIIEHRIEDVLHRDVDRIVLMGEGRILADTTPDQLLSGSLLKENGIREPLYITALKYAGVNITPDKLPHSIRSLLLSEEDKVRVRAWYEQTPHNTRRSEAPVVLDAKNVAYTYDNGHQALQDISLQVRKGEMLAIVGTNGAGKTTFSNVCLGFLPGNKGTITLNGEDISGLSIKERGDRIGYVMQNPNQMISHVQIRDEIALGLRLRDVPEEDIDKALEKVLKICGLWKMRNWPISALSFGQKKRVTVAAILAMNPEMLILDEPTAGQDYRHYTDIMEFLKRINDSGITVVMITHDMHLMLEYADRAVVFTGGRVIADDLGSAILTNPDIVRRANLKETSLYDLALMCSIEDPSAFAQGFIDYERTYIRKDKVEETEAPLSEAVDRQPINTPDTVAVGANRGEVADHE